MPWRYVINLQKAGTGLFCFGLMWKYQNFSLAAYSYTALHGTYGLVWLMKDAIHPDPQWDLKISLWGALNSFLIVLGPYWYAAWHTIANRVEVSPPRMALAVFLNIIGVVMMMGSDVQKFYVLKERRRAGTAAQSGQKKASGEVEAAEKKKSLISDGWFSRCRNPNYLGEMLIYGSFAVLAQSWIAWGILGSIWGTLFLRNMWMKEVSLRKKDGWKEYERRSGFLFPYLGRVSS
uniref:Uncharacterized protein n=1 Tax=Chromera velia CCMP2878 TaxID=1169474 RepID=A0A0G4GC52_9ALVE|eukprot:Cvel_21173.t1-p1 / transcript=Cvel_21173.t1 / gene=Cvel_21173 / organism=Chromera_velia_CCMP2878 / gene_product=hypothetical protein / transcript_product=hypothetical protein / location=Cvel_scaffold1965:8269-9961(+) / protein_length=233 / sequence_SO=supercontig / SO=protein_coding / is_pseudo=false